ncbi:hypothetical protein [Corallibacter sp.]|uniref:hypothetical protein n=1 Tax=Corallibacter sp. TaxID=2038084 RepID=UPI003AB293A3
MNANQKLVTLVFEKAAKESQSDVLTQQAKFIVNAIDERYGIPITDKTLRNYYNDLVKGNNPDSTIRQDIADSLSKYLGYDDFREFISDNIVVKEKTKMPKNIPQRMLIGSLVLLTGYFGYEATANKCMTWIDNTHYEKVDCEAINTVPIDERLLSKFERVEPDENYPFFKEDGSPNLWYGKSIKGDYEYFTNYGIHPVTGKTLKGITDYMIDKYILINE